MDLKQRLDALRMASGTVPDKRQRNGQGMLQQRLEEMHRVRNKMPKSSRSKATTAILTNRLQGEQIAEGVVRVERRLPLPHPGLREWRQSVEALPEATRASAPDWVFIDTETTGLAGGTGTVVFLLGMARVDGETLQLCQLMLSSFAGEKAMLEAAMNWLGDTAGLVSYNGKTFDVPLIKTRARLGGLDPGIWERPHLDLLYGVRRCFESHWQDCRLATAERELLGVRRHHDLPGSEAPRAWLGWLRRGEAGSLQGVLDHNRQDLLSLAGLLPVLAEIQTGKAWRPCNIGRIARAWLRQGDIGRALTLLEAHRSRLGAEDRLMLAGLRQRQGDRDGARAVLEALAASGNLQAIERLAGYHEHMSGDFGAAADYAQRLPPSPERERRLQRVRRKQGLTHPLPLSFE